MLSARNTYLEYLQVSFHFYLDVKKEPQSPLESDDFFVFPKHLEMLGEKAKDCGVSLSLEWTGMETEASDTMGVTYILYRCQKHQWARVSWSVCVLCGCYKVESIFVFCLVFRRFAPDFFQGCSVEETRLHSLQLHPMYTGNHFSGYAEYTACSFHAP